MIRTTLFVSAALAVLLVAGRAPLAAADDQTKPSVAPAPWVAITSHDISGFVVRTDLPAGWRLTMATKGDLIYRAPSEKDGSYVTFHVRVMKAFDTSGMDMPEAEILAMFLGMSQPQKDAKVLAESRVAISAMNTLHRTLRFAKKTSGAVHGARSFLGMAAGHTVYAEVQGHGAAAAKRVLDKDRIVERLLGSLTIEETAKASAKVRDAMGSMFVPKAARLSSRRGYWIDLTPSLYVPKGWTVAEAGRQHAGRGREQGAYAVQLIPPGGAQTPDGPKALILVLEGLPVGPLSRGQFINSVDPRVERLLPGAKRVAETQIEHDGLRRLARSNTRYTTGTGTTVVRTYDHARSGGKAMRLKSYTAGGMTVASHLLVIAPRDQHEAFEAEAQELIDTYRVFMKSPSIR